MYTHEEKTVGTLISLLNKGGLQDVVETLASQVLEEHASFNWWCSHPERIFAYGRVRGIAGGFMIAGPAYYKGQHEWIRIVIRNDSYINCEIKRSALIDDKGDEAP